MMDAIEVTFTETISTTARVHLHEDRRKLLRERFGAGPYTEDQLVEFLEEDQIVYFDEDEAEIVTLAVHDRDIEDAKLVTKS